MCDVCNQQACICGTKQHAIKLLVEACELNMDHRYAVITSVRVVKPKSTIEITFKDGQTRIFKIKE